MTPEQILAILTGIQATLALINSAAYAARERGEWTPEQEQAFDEQMLALKAKDYWQRTD